MEKRAFGNTDMQVSILGFGGAEIGFENVSLNVVKDLLAAALDQGLNVIDTAECYAGSEELIGNAVGKRRKDFYLFSKCGHGENFSDAWSKSDIAKTIERSLKRLKTDYIDLVQLHSCSEDLLKKGEAVEALEKAKKEGKVRYIGYSGDSDAALYAINTGVFDALQTSVSIADQEAIERLLPRAQEKKMGVIAKRPIANAAWRSKSKPSNSYHVEYWERLHKLNYDFINGNPALAAATALRFTLSIPGVSVAIVGTTKPGRWIENAEVLAQGMLSGSQFEAIRAKWQAVATTEWMGQT
ncbi:MAG TPA: aldo/keto reductase [Oculatellaceae cyanobacterium]